MSTNGVNLLYLVTIVCFVLALRFLSSPATARRGNQIGAVGMVIAIVATLLKPSVHVTWLICPLSAPAGDYRTQAHAIIRFWTAASRVIASVPRRRADRVRCVRNRFPRRS